MRKLLKWKSRKYPSLFLAYALLIVIALVLIAYQLYRFQWLPDVIETWTYDIHPSAELAFEDGEHHFDSSRYPQSYDIDRAEYYFRLALAQDPHLPYIYHELARVAFLRGEFNLALTYIDFQIQNEGDKTPNSYYVRALVEGFMSDYTDAEADYAHYLAYDPIDWAAVNDYSWVLLKDSKPRQADAAIEKVLPYFPGNPWLLNSDAIALSEMGDISLAKTRISAASQALAKLTPESWTNAYPGNDPNIAPEGLDAFRAAVSANMHSIDTGSVAHALQ